MKRARKTIDGGRERREPALGKKKKFTFCHTNIMQANKQSQAFSPRSPKT